MNGCRASAQLCAVRAAVLDTNGVPRPGTDTLYVTDQTISIVLSPVIQAGEELQQPNGCGKFIVDAKSADQYRWWNMTLQLGSVDFELHELLTTGVIHTLGANNVGYGAPPLGDRDDPDPISLELWTKRILGQVQDSDFPYWRWVVPYLRNMRHQGDITLDNSPHNLTFRGEAVENSNWFDGPLNDWDTLSDVDADRAWQYVMDSGIPTASCGYLSLAAS